MVRLSGWGRYPIAETALISPRTLEAAQAATADADGFVARGNGRAYGDAGIGTHATISMKALDRFRSFDAETGQVTVEAGVLLADLITALLPRGFFPKAIPGTCFVTIGGAIAADVHGKNHHRDGGFGDHVRSLVLATAAGEVVHASREENADIFFATVGGMGLTGTILEATLDLKRIETGWIRQHTIVAPDLAAALAALDASDDVTYSVAWIDCASKGASLGRSLVFLGEHARLAELDEEAATNPFPRPGNPRLSVPVDFPSLALNRWSIRAFNELYYRLGARRAGAPFLLAAKPYFFPLDGVGEWNRIYGRRGFIQHQCVLPADKAAAVLAEMLNRITDWGTASFLAVLKKLGSSNGVLSFPFKGYTLALDFPLTRGLLSFLEELDQLIAAAGGRIYLAKDARQSPATFEAGYPNLGRFREIRKTVDPSGRIRSRLAERLAI